MGLGKCQARDFASQIACASLAAIQYNLLSVVKRYNAYETIGALFRETCSGAMELTIVERIWGAVMEMVIAVTSVFNITDEEIYDAVINLKSLPIFVKFIGKKWPFENLRNLNK